MSRKKFIITNGATCNNWTWSWSFINKEEKFIIFGTWQNDDDPELLKAVVLKDGWVKQKGRKAPGFTQAESHIERIVKDGYQLKIFKMYYAEKVGDNDVAKINGFDPHLYDRVLKKENDVWYAVLETDENIFPDEVALNNEYIEGALKSVTVNAFERNRHAREECIKIHGCICYGCGFDFEKVYGVRGQGFIHVHHINSLRTIRKEYKLNAKEHLIPLCPNCHAMIHRKDPELTLSELKVLLNSNI